MNRIACVIVTYNRKELLINNIQSLLLQNVPIDIIVIDNASTDGTFDFLMEKGLLSLNNVIYNQLDNNVGGAGGFSAGTKYAFEKKYDYICLMDDDGFPLNENTIKALISKADDVLKDNPLIMLNSLVLCDEDKLSFGLAGGIDTKEKAVTESEDGLIFNKINPFNGTLLSYQLVNQIGFPNCDFFIKGDEHDYYIRAKEAGAVIATVTDSLYSHPKLPLMYKVVNGKKVIIRTESPWKEYYRARNYTYMFKKSKKYKLMMFQPYNQIKCALVADCDKWKTIRMIIKGTIDGFFGKLGATVKP